MVTTIAGQTQAIVVYMTMADLAQAMEAFTMTDRVRGIPVCTMTGLEPAMEACIAMIGLALATGACMMKAGLGQAMGAIEESSGAFERRIIFLRRCSSLDRSVSQSTCR